MIEYTWTIKELRTEGGSGQWSGVVTQIYYSLTATDTETGRSQELHGSYVPARYNPDQPLPEGFTDYEHLSKEQVTKWLETMPSVDEVKKHVTDALLADDPEAEAAKAPALPWSD